MDPYEQEKKAIEARYPIHNKMTRQQIVEAQTKRRDDLINLYGKRGEKYLGGMIE